MTATLKHIAPSLEFLLEMFVSHGYNVNDVRKYENQKITLSHIPPEYLPHVLAEAAKAEIKTIQLNPIINLNDAPCGESEQIPTTGQSPSTHLGGNDEESSCRPFHHPKYQVLFVPNRYYHFCLFLSSVF